MRRAQILHIRQFGTNSSKSSIIKAWIVTVLEFTRGGNWMRPINSPFTLLQWSEERSSTCWNLCHICTPWPLIINFQAKRNILDPKTSSHWEWRSIHRNELSKLWSWHRFGYLSNLQVGKYREFQAPPEEQMMHKSFTSEDQNHCVIEK